MDKELHEITHKYYTNLYNYLEKHFRRVGYVFYENMGQHTGIVKVSEESLPDVTREVNEKTDWSCLGMIEEFKTGNYLLKLSGKEFPWVPEGGTFPIVVLEISEEGIKVNGN